MIPLEKRIAAFSRLGEILSKVASKQPHGETASSVLAGPITKVRNLITDVYHFNGWFTEPMVRYMIGAIGESLKREDLEHWAAMYQKQLKQGSEPKTIGVVMAGNIPLVGFHDLLTVLLSRNRILAKLSSDDDKLLPAIADLLIQIEPGFKEFIEFADGKLAGFDAIIATGSNNTARYFDYYFGKYPNIIRKNRTGVAVLAGIESAVELNELSNDIFRYYGLGCRNVSKIFVPEGYDFSMLLDTLGSRNDIAENHKYFNNYEYNKAIYLVNSTAHLDCGNVLLTQDTQFASPVSVLYYEYYRDLETLIERLKAEAENIQCVVSTVEKIPGAIPPGMSQQPKLWDYADGVDTMNFILSIDS